VTDAGRGRHLLGQGPDELLRVEVAAGLVERFQAIDEIASTLLSDALRGKRIASVPANGKETSLVLALSASQRRLIDREYAATTQQARGAWWLPDDAPLKPGLLNLPALVRGQRGFPHNVADGENGRFSLANPQALFLWAVLQGLFEAVLAPLELGARAPGKSSEDNRKAWMAVDSTYTSLGLDASILGSMRYGSGWARLRIDAQRQVERDVIGSLADQATALTVKRWRAVRVGELAARYYAKSKRGPATHREVLTKPLAPVLAGYFGGDWLAFLDYIGEGPSPGDQIVTVLPQSHLYVEGSDKVREVATAKGVPLEEVQRMLATFYGEASVQSPVERRVALMRQFWAAFDEIHSRQGPGMPSLWGLVDDGFGFAMAIGDQPYNPGIYRRLLPPDLVAEVDELWGTECLERWPDRVVSATHPHKLLAGALGPALSFWHGCALTAWFICEGPYSRTDLPGMEHYYRRELEALAEAGLSVDRSFFAELVDAEQRLGPPVPIVTEVSEHEVAPGIVIRTSMSSGSRQDGFEILRDIVTSHRRCWAGAHLDGYLRSRWEPQLRTVAWEHSRWVAAKGKGPTLKQFAKFAAPAANAWFGGNLGDLFGAVGEKPPVKPQRVALMPPNRVALAALVFNSLGGEPVAGEDAWRNRERYDRQAAIRRLADEAPRYIQLQEALDRPPSIKEMRADSWRWPDGIEAIWPYYAEIVEHSRLTAMDVPAALPLDVRLPAPPSSSPQIARPDFPRPTFQPAAAPPPPPAQAAMKGTEQEPSRKRSLLDRFRRRS